jgi:hypothetical protein
MRDNTGKEIKLSWKNFPGPENISFISNPEIPLLNNLYKHEWRLFHNFFCPSVKLISKKRVASKTIKHYDSPKTPYQRIMESLYITDDVKHSLTTVFKKLDPFDLRKAIEDKLKKIFKTCYKKSP